MIISEGRRYIFVHISKTGGTSLALALEERAMRDDILIGDTPKAKRRRNRLRHLPPAKGRLWKHAMLSDIDGIVAPEALDRYFVFTMVRNPWDRAVSYYHWLRTQRFDHAAVRLAGSLSFADFLRHPTTRKGFRQTPASRYLLDATGRMRGDLIIRLEHFQEDAAPLMDHLGFDFDLPHVNTSERADDYRDYYDTDLAALIATDCAEDIARFGYRFSAKSDSPMG